MYHFFEETVPEKQLHPRGGKKADINIMLKHENPISVVCSPFQFFLTQVGGAWLHAKTTCSIAPDEICLRANFYHL